ncbi:unnamed protein product [Adineta steineri]|uniref:Uncharacterized protein n=1 Tax=Adineta steineri TaxID=433720 RepID=A0A815MLS8_9BILA|nr:unnamed protein product [Adineta steineri]CAF3992079.1 unnamed protein product [Adineta steineri]
MSNQTQSNSSDSTMTIEVENRVLLPIMWRRSANDYFNEEEERRFRGEFENRVLTLVRQLNRRFPYKHSVIWTIEYDENKEYCIHVMANQHRS